MNTVGEKKKWTVEELMIPEAPKAERKGYRFTAFCDEITYHMQTKRELRKFLESVISTRPAVFKNLDSGVTIDFDRI